MKASMARGNEPVKVDEIERIWEIGEILASREARHRSGVVATGKALLAPALARAGHVPYATFGTGARPRIRVAPGAVDVVARVVADAR